MAADKELKLLDFWTSPFGIRCRIALAEKGVEYEYKEEISLKEKSELLLKSNPVHKKIPVLLHNGKAICESLIIIQYIDDIFPGKAPILPSDPYARARARFWADYVDKKFYDAAVRLGMLKKGEATEEAKNEFVETLITLEVELGEKKYFGGEDFGLVDIAFVPFTSCFYSFEVLFGVSAEQECPKLVAWGNRCKERESVAKSLPEQKKLHDYFASQRNQLGLD